MTTHRFGSRLRSSLLLAALALALGACGSRARFEIVRPALLDASAFGNTFEVQPFGGVDGTAAYRVQALLQQRVGTSLNPSIQLLAGGGGVIVGGQILDHSYGESFSSSRATCYRTEYYNDSNGRRQSRSVPYECTQVTRTGIAHSAIRITVAIASTGQVVWDRVYEGSRQAETSATNGTPRGIDGGSMLAELVDVAVADFAPVILPWPDQVVVAFSDCGHAEGCDAAWQLVQRSDLTGAEALYTQILGPYDQATGAVDPEDTEIVADTLFNRGIVRAYSGSYELGIADIERALSIRPQESEWAQELARIETLAGEYDQLRQQIEGPQPSTQPVTAGAEYPAGAVAVQ